MYRKSAAARPTTWRVTRLPDPSAVSVTCDGEDFAAWRVAGEATIELDTTIAEHRFRITTGYHGPAGTPPASTTEARPAAPITTLYTPSASPACTAPCCG